MSSSNVAIVPEYLDTGGGSVNNIVITGINGVIVTETTPGNFEVSISPTAVTAGAGITVSSPTPGNFQVVSNVGVTGQNGVIVTQPTPSNYVIVRDPAVSNVLSAITGPFATTLTAGGSPQTLGALNVTGLPFINPNVNVTVRAILSGTCTGFFGSTNQFRLGLYDSTGAEISVFDSGLISLPDYDFGPTIPSSLNITAPIGSLSYASLITCSFKVFIVFGTGIFGSIANANLQLSIQYNN
jgi:hypothetical protein